MPIRVNCPGCGSVINAPDKAAGKTGKCPKCGNSVTIPLPEAPAAPPVAPWPMPSENPVPVQPPAVPAGPLVVAPSPPPPGAAPAANMFDVEVEDDFDVEFDDAAPPAKAVSAPSVPAVPSPSFDPFASFGPPPDSAAAKLNSVDSEAAVPTIPASEAPTTTGEASALPPLAFGWQSVQAGLGKMKTGAMLLLIGLILIIATLPLAALKLPWIVFPIASSIGGVVVLLGSIWTLIGLFRCQKAPPVQQGGPGPEMAQYSFYIGLGTILLSGCGIGPVLAIAWPFTIALFLKSVGRALTHKPTAQAANRFLISIIVAIGLGLVLGSVPVILALTVFSSKSAGTTLLIIILATLATSLFLELIVVGLYFLALNTATTELAKQIRVRNLAEPSAKSTAKMPSDEAEKVEDEQGQPKPKPKPGKRPPLKNDHNPFA